MPDYVVPWVDILEYLKECRERTILDLSDAQDERLIYRAQGKLALLEELLQMRDILVTLKSLGKE